MVQRVSISIDFYECSLIFNDFLRFMASCPLRTFIVSCGFSYIFMDCWLAGWLAARLASLLAGLSGLARLAGRSVWLLGFVGKRLLQRTRTRSTLGEVGGLANVWF